jgi:hypothetical protein
LFASGWVIHPNTAIIFYVFFQSQQKSENSLKLFRKFWIPAMDPVYSGLQVLLQEGVDKKDPRAIVPGRYLAPAKC